MAVNRRKAQFSVGPSYAFAKMAPLPISARRAPTARDGAQLGQLWIDQVAGLVYAFVGGAVGWSTSAPAGATVLASLQVNPGNAVVTAGDLTVSAGNFDVTVGTANIGGNTTLGADLAVTGNSTFNGTLLANGAATFSSTAAFNGNVTITGNLAITGDFDITDTASISLSSTNNAAGAITLNANGGAAETILIRSQQGTGATSLNLVSTVGGVTLNGGLASVNAINLTASNAAGGMTFSAGTAGMVHTIANGPFTVTTGTGAVSISADATANSLAFGTGAGAKLVSIGSANGVSSLTMNSGTGGATLDSTGAISLQAAAASDFSVSGAGVDLVLSSAAGRAVLNGEEAAADALRLLSAAGGLDANVALQMNLDSSQAAADALRLVASNAAGGIDVDAGTAGIAIDTTGALSLDSAAASNFTVTGAFDLTLSSSAGSVIVQGAEAAADAVQINASNAAGGLDFNAGTGGVAVDAVGGSIALTAGTGANGSVTLTSTGTGDIILNSDDTMLLDADGVLELNSSAGAINIGNDADANAINVGSAGARAIQVGNATAGTTVLLLGPANIGVTLQNSIRIMTGAGSPDTLVTAPAGSLWLRTDPAGATSRIYVNTDSATAWTNVTCAA